jgi:hypothetical protein
MKLLFRLHVSLQSCYVWNAIVFTGPRIKNQVLRMIRLLSVLPLTVRKFILVPNYFSQTVKLYNSVIEVDAQNHRN